VEAFSVRFALIVVGFVQVASHAPALVNAACSRTSELDARPEAEEVWFSLYWLRLEIE
jgi:hypothetical protein